MEIKDLVRVVYEALREGPATFDEITQRTHLQPGEIWFALGALEAVGEIGYSKDFLFVLKADAVGEAIKPFAYQSVLDSLREDGPGTFQEISDRVGVNPPSEIGFALGWLYGEGKTTVCGEQGRERWCLIEDE